MMQINGMNLSQTSKKLDVFYKTKLDEYNPELADHLKEHNYGF